MNREEKIGFLKGLQQGIRKIKDLLPARRVIRIFPPGKQAAYGGFFIDGVKVSEEKYFEGHDPANSTIKVTLMRIDKEKPANPKR
ncbi:MAG: hypothetical protein JWM28_2051 [Chitinophagaceae bacterium]|nr:hypothetical protein [Chitinophagaceae bacterium]